MDPRLVELCFGTPQLPEDVDLEDEGSVLDHFVDRLGAQDDDPDALVPSNAGTRAAARAAVARQLLDREPFDPAVEAANRMLDAGVAPEDALRQMSAATLASIIRAMGPAISLEPVGPDDDEVGLAQLVVGPLELPELYDALPFPSFMTVRSAVLGAIRRGPGRGTGEILDEAAAELARDGEDDGGVVRTMCGRVMENLLVQGVLAILHPDRLVDRSTVLADAVATHRITEADHEIGLLLYDDDLATLVPPMDEHALTSADVTLRVGVHQFPVGALVTVVFDGPSLIVTLVPPEGDDVVEISDELARTVRECYEIEHQDGMAVDIGDLVVAVALRQPGVWSRPHPPVTDIVAAAGLERRNGRVAGDAETWRHEHRLAVKRRLAESVDIGEADGRRLFHLVDELFCGDDEGPPRLTRAVVAALRDPESGPLLAEALVGEDDADEDDQIETAATFESLAALARHDDERAIALWLTSLFHERQGRLAVAEQLVAEAYRLDPTWNPVVERMGWYAFLRGDAATALQQWRRLGRANDREMAIAERFGSTSSARHGRNDPCWCGSGRKYKACHLGVVETASLADRVDWIWAKAVGYLLRRGDEAIGDLAELCGARADDPSDEVQLQAAFNDPVVLDTALVYFDWFIGFVQEAGELLPADELALAQQWLRIDRSVFEVAELLPGGGVVLRDRQTQERYEVHQPLPGRAVKTGDLCSTRLVPDGTGHRPVGGLLRIRPDEEDELLDILNDGAAVDLCEYLRDRAAVR